VTASVPLSPELRRLVDEAGPGAYVARADDAQHLAPMTEWCWAVPELQNWHGGAPPLSPSRAAVVIVRPRRVTVEVPVDLLERLLSEALSSNVSTPPYVTEARRLIDEARSDTSGGTT
jgi:hypothetical protein